VEEVFNGFNFFSVNVDNIADILKCEERDADREHYLLNKGTVTEETISELSKMIHQFKVGVEHFIK
jgi:hypothetical protein